jgi:hypothetical protein
MKLIWILAVLVVVVSCGASAAEIKTAREARYKADPATLYAAAKAETERGYKIAAADDAAFMLQTEPRWYTPEGQADAARGNNIARLQENSINFSVVVRLAKVDADSYKVIVDPVALRLRGLSSKPEPLDPKDPSAPGWVQGKLESLQLGIHERLKPYAISGATVPAMMPATPPPAAPPPAAPSPAGSAAPAAPADPAAPAAPAAAS